MAWSNIDNLRTDGSKVHIPSLYNVEEAKDWVDNGSRL
ncbi:CDIF630_02480 family spore surface protein [Romboutsia sp. 13368]